MWYLSAYIWLEKEGNKENADTGCVEIMTVILSNESKMQAQAPDIPKSDLPMNVRIQVHSHSNCSLSDISWP